VSGVHELLRERLLRQAGLDAPVAPLRSETFDSLYQSEWSPEFERLMRNRMVMGALRYGKLRAPGKPVYDRIGSIRRRLDAYEATGNKELLVDAANLLLLEFEECHHPLAHFAALDDTPERVRVSRRRRR
jgi:hypothetical protein